MSTVRRAWARVISFFRKRELDREFNEELAAHIDLATQDYVRQGMSPAEARLAARVRLGGIAHTQELHREGRGLAWLDGIVQDVRHAFRGLRRSPGFAAVAIASLTLGIGANTAIFSFVNAILLKKLPVPEPERLVSFSQTYRGKRSGVVWRLKNIDDLAKQTRALSGIFGWFARPISLSTGATAEWVNGEMVTGQYFQTLEVKPAAGRLLNEQDVRDASGNPVCVLSYGLWQREFAGDPGVVGRTVLLNGQGYRVIGVTERRFHGATLQRRFDVAVPATRVGDFMPAFRGGGSLGMDRLSWVTPMGRLQPGISRAEAEQRIQSVLRGIDPQLKDAIHLEDGSQGFGQMRPQFGQPLLVLMAVAGLVLLVACANLANLLLARTQARGREFAVRLSLGAPTGRLMRQLLVESFLLAGAGGVAGIALSFWITGALLGFLNTGRAAASALHVTPDTTVLAFSILLSSLTAVLVGLAPAWQAARPELAAGVKQESLSGAPRRVLLRRALVVVQIAVSLVIVFSAGLLTRTLRTLATVDPGFQPERVIAFNIDPAANGHSAAESTRIFDEILRRARALPGVKAASLALSTPMGSVAISMTVDVPGYVAKPVRGDSVATFNFVSPGYFETLGQRLIAGRDFDEHDTGNRPRVAIVNQKFVEHFFGGRNPLGRKLRQGGGDVEIVGVAADARDHGIRRGPDETVYLSEKQGQTSGLTVLVRAAEDPQKIIPALAGIAGSIDRRMPVLSVHTVEVDVEAGLSSERILSYLSMLFGALVTVLAGIGLYGVLAYSMARRTREIGIRFAVGAQSADVAGLFARESLLLLLAGLLLGGPLALVSARALGTLLFGVGASDAATLGGSVAVLTAAALLATSIPLWRAARIDPAACLRQE